MVDILSEKTRNYSGGVIVARMEIVVDTASELPAVDAFAGRRIAMGSIAWDISSGDFYGLNSSGEWILQNTSAVSGDTISAVANKIMEVNSDVRTL